MNAARGGRVGRKRLAQWARARDRGANAVELAIIAPILIILIFFTIQAGLFYYGRTVAVQAAREGVSQLRLAESVEMYEQMRGQVTSSTEEFARKVGGQGLINPEVSTEYSDDEGRVWVEVSGQVITLVPGMALTASAEASGTVERFLEPERP